MQTASKNKQRYHNCLVRDLLSNFQVKTICDHENVTRIAIRLRGFHAYIGTNYKRYEYDVYMK